VETEKERRQKIKEKKDHIRKGCPPKRIALLHFNNEAFL